MKPERKTLEQELAALQEETAVKEVEIRTRHEILRTFPEGGPQPSVFVHRLYDREASVTFQAKFQDLAGIVECSPVPLPAAKAKGTFMSFVTQDYAEKMERREKEHSRKCDVELIFPYFVRVEPNFTPRLKFEWFAQHAERTLEFKVEVPLYDQRYLQVHSRFKDHPGYRTCESCDLSVDGAFITVPKLASGASPIRWGRGSSEYANDFTYYWHPLGNATPEEQRQGFVTWLRYLSEVRNENRH